MSTLIVDYFGVHDLTLTQYWGGDEKGICVQVTGLTREGAQYVDLTVDEAYKLSMHLIGWIKDVSEQRAEKVQTLIDKDEVLRKTMLNDAVKCAHFIADLKMLKVSLKLLEWGK